jgi:CRP-like cAMP-binding protein
MANSGLNLLVRRLEGHCRLSADDRDALLGLPVTTRTLPAGSYLVREGDRPRSCFVLLSGYAFRHKIVGDGGRQIVSVHIPGEVMDYQSLYLQQVDHNAQTLGEVTAAILSIADVQELTDKRPAIARAMLLDVLIEASILREWMTRVGRRSARARLAHLMCEFATRMEAQGLTQEGGYQLPLTQEQIGDALGLTSVHVNRSIKGLEEDGLITRQRRTLRFPNIEGLRKVADFSELYLHRDQGSNHLL